MYIWPDLLTAHTRRMYNYRTRRKSKDLTEDVAEAESAEDETDDEEVDEEEDDVDGGAEPKLKERNAYRSARQSSVYVPAEERVIGAVKGSTYLTYLQNGGWVFGVVIIFLLLIR